MIRPGFIGRRPMHRGGISLLLLMVLAGCSGAPAAQKATETVLVTATTTVTATPQTEPSWALDPEGQRRDAQHIVELVCRVESAYQAFNRVADDLVARPQALSEAKELAADVAFNIEGMSTLLAMGPVEGWTDPWLAIRAIQFADTVDTSRAFFESAAQSKSVDDFISLYFGVLNDPIDSPTLGDLPEWLPPEQADQLLKCAAA